MSASYSKAKIRCTDKNYHAYHRYGGRGILFNLGGSDEFILKMHKTWFNGAQLDRIDTDGNYEYSNIRWVTPVENNFNKSQEKEYRGTKIVKYNKFVAQIKIGGENYYIGTFENRKEAHIAFVEVHKEWYGNAIYK